MCHYLIWKFRLNLRMIGPEVVGILPPVGCLPFGNFLGGVGLFKTPTRKSELFSHHWRFGRRDLCSTKRGSGRLRVGACLTSSGEGASAQSSVRMTYLWFVVGRDKKGTHYDECPSQRWASLVVPCLCPMFEVLLRRKAGGTQITTVFDRFHGSGML